MALIRCTCIYRPTSAQERARNAATVTVACRDPHCPAAATHELADRARAATLSR